MNSDRKAHPAPIARLLLSHGAGAGKDSEFMLALDEALASLGVEVQRFDFPYMQQMTKTGKRRPPDKLPKLQSHFAQQIVDVKKDLPLFIAGKSMGGRVATTLLSTSEAAEGLEAQQQALVQEKVCGCICYGYPFHPPGKPDKLRTAHLCEVALPMLIVQGERDTFGNQTEVGGYLLHEKISVAFLQDGDHSFKPRKASGLTQQQHLTSAAQLTHGFIKELL